MRLSWDEVKRASNLQDHGLDFIDAPEVFEGPTFTYKDDRFDYGEERFVTLGLLRGIVMFDRPHRNAETDPYHLFSQGDQA